MLHRLCCCSTDSLGAPQILLMLHRFSWCSTDWSLIRLITSSRSRKLLPPPLLWPVTRWDQIWKISVTQKFCSSWRKCDPIDNMHKSSGIFYLFYWFTGKDHLYCKSFIGKFRIKWWILFPHCNPENIRSLYNCKLNGLSSVHNCELIGLVCTMCTKL